jgi:serine/threonine-protein kinase
MTPERFREVDALFSRALEVEERDRAAFLDAACSRDGELRRQVESLLAANAASATFLERPALQLAAGALADDTGGQAEEPGAGAPPRTVGRYVVERELGRGGMGSVYAARDPELGRKIAIKLIHAERPGPSDPDRSRARLLREAQALARVTHPNVVAIYDVGTFEGQVFIAMEYVEGSTLTDWLAGEPRTPSEIVSMLVQAGRGLAAAHAQGVVHRDFKPDNVWIGSDGRARVLDFGLARATCPVEAEPPGTDLRVRDPTRSPPPTAALAGPLTEPGRFLGTPAYMAPEQLKRGPVDARTDQFSFCVALHQALHGELPFAGKGASELLAAIEQRRIAEGPNARRVPARVRRALRRGLSPDPADRFDSMDRLLVALERRPATNRRRVATAGALALLAAAALLAQMERGGDGVPGRAIRSLAVLPLEPLAEKPGQGPDYVPEEITDGLTMTLAQIKALRVISRTSAMRYVGRKLPLSQIARELKVDALVEGTVAWLGERVRVSVHLVDGRNDRQLWAESYEADVRDLPALQRELARAIADRIRIELTPGERTRFAASRQVSPLAYEAYARGRYFWNKRTAEGFQKALGYFTEAISRDPGYALAYAGLADTYNVLALFGVLQSEEACPQAKRAALRALELDDGLAEAHTSLARYYENYERDWAAAEREYRLGIEVNPGYATGHAWYAAYLSAQGRYEEALAESNKAHQLDPFSLTINTALGMALAEGGREDLAIERLHETVEMDPSFSYVHFQLGRTYLRTHAFADAIAEFEKAAALSPTMPRYASALAHAYGRAGKSAEALGILEQLERGSPAPTPSWIDIAIARSGLGQNDQAFAALEKALEHREWRLVRIQVEPMFDPLRTDPRFAALLRRIGLPP